MSDRPTVSVVIPTRDRPEMLRRAVAAVAAQTADAELECIVVFDRTDPALPDVAERPGFRLISTTNTRSPGLAGARNSGALAATGEYLAFCDDDDEWLPDKLRGQLELAAGGEAAGAISCAIEVHYDGKAFTRFPEREVIGYEDLLRSRHTELHPSTFLFRRDDFFGAIGMVDEGLPGSYAEDYEWLLRAARVAPIRSVPEPLVRVHWHRSSFFEGRWRTVASALSYLLDRYPDFREVPRGYARIAGQIAFAEAATGNAGPARTWARRAFSASWREPRTYLALGVTLGARPETVVRLVHGAGKGI